MEIIIKQLIPVNNLLAIYKEGKKEKETKVFALVLVEEKEDGEMQQVVHGIDILGLNSEQTFLFCEDDECFVEYREVKFRE